VIEKWGGKVLVRAPVSSILTDNNNKAYGVVVNGLEILAKLIVSSVGTPTTMTKLIPESHHSIIRMHIDVTKHKNVASNTSLMSMFVGIGDPEGKFNLPKSNFWVHQSWQHDKNATKYKKEKLKILLFFILFSSAKDPTYATRHPGKQAAMIIGACSYDDVERFKNDHVKHRSSEYISRKKSGRKSLFKCCLTNFQSFKGKSSTQR
jgi:all-trans-retinol 13,14-reductase